jgi:hypothetical protein
MHDHSGSAATVQHLVQILVPRVPDPHRSASGALIRELMAELTQRFGGATAFARSPAVGLWRDDDDRTERDDIVVLEIMVERLEREWWRSLRARLESRLGQDEVVIRASPIERL